jgi:hypothetical protein
LEGYHEIFLDLFLTCMDLMYHFSFFNLINFSLLCFSDNLQLLRQRYYYATWKADGTRYMMLIMRDGCFLIDRNFVFRRVQMRFPHKSLEVRFKIMLAKQLYYMIIFATRNNRIA